MSDQINGSLLAKEIDEYVRVVAEEFSEPMPTNSDDRSISILRQRISSAESYGVQVSSLLRKLTQFVDIKKSIILSELSDDEAYRKAKVTERKTMVNSRISKELAYLEELETLQDLVKRRCSVGQSLLKSVDTESRSSWNGGTPVNL